MTQGMDDSDRRVRSHVAATAAIAAGFIVALLLLLISEQAPPPQAAPSPEPTPAPQGQQTLLVQVTLERVRTASLLTASGGDLGDAVLLSLPADVLLVDGPAYTPLLDANLSLNRRLTAQATANTLGVRVDGGWRMERKALAGLVDAVGGVTVSAPAPTVFLDTLGQPVLDLPAGESHLVGPEASWYVMGVVAGEDPIGGVQIRFEEVFVKAVQRLPASEGEVAALLTSLGALSDPLNGTSDVAERLVALRGAFLAEQLQSVGLPFRASSAADPVVTRQESDSGPTAAVGAFRVTDYIAATPMLREAFRTAPRVADVDGPPRVLVWNASSEPRASEVALLELTDADFVAVSAGTWPSLQPITRINGRGYFPGGLSYAGGAAEALRLSAPEMFGDTGTAGPSASPSRSPSPSPGAVATMPPADQTPTADVDVVFGNDYQPCPPDEPDCLKQEQA